MIENGIKALWRQDKPVLNGWLSVANAFTAEVYAQQGYDSVTVDMQHGMIDFESGLAMIQTMRASGVVPMVRVPWLDPGPIMKSLDAGAYGVICPMINNRDEAERFVSYMRYPPDGTRSFGPARALFSAGADYPAHANDEMLAFAMIETAAGVANIEDICATPGLDAVYIGPSDLTIGYTNGKLPPGFDRTEPEMVDVIRRILSCAHDAGIRAALHCGSPAYAAKAIGWGFDLVTLPNDLRILAVGAKAGVDETRRLMAKD